MSSPQASRDVTDARPNAHSKWICGYQRLGFGCSEGPDQKGNCCQLRPDRSRPTDNAICHQECDCNAGCELAHLRRKPELPSHVELGPCLPQRAAWLSRQTLSLNIALLAGGLLLLSMTLPQREAVFVPGGLTQKHAQILGNRLVAERCSQCHLQAHANSPAAAIQDDLCLHCHSGHLPAASLRNPHDLASETLTKLTAKANPYVALTAKHKLQQTSCAMCHVEHRGSDFDIKAISDASCQSCHQQQFTSLSAGHPQFDEFPSRMPRAIAFDHTTHQNKHFGTKNEVFQCNRCHLGNQDETLSPQASSGRTSNLTRSTSFEQACGSCHQASLDSSIMQGWAMLQLPSIETSDAQSELPELSHWPSTARFGYEGEIDVPLRLLLIADPALRVTLNLLPNSGQLQHLPQEAGQRAQATRTIAAGIRRLIADVAREGHIALRKRLTTTGQLRLGRELTLAESQLIDSMLNGIPPDLFRHMERTWFRPDAEAGPSSTVGTKMVGLPTHDKGLPQDEGLLDGGLLQEQRLLPNEELLSEEGLLSGSEDSLLNGDTSLNDESLLNSDSLLNKHAELAPDSVKDAPQHYQGWTHVAAGGWYLDQELLALRYMPSGHADPTLAAWASYIALVEQANAGTVRGAEVPTAQSSSLTHGKAIPGGCTQCHLQQSRSTTTEFSLHWTSFQQATTERPFTKFDHRPHLTLPALSDCSYCHKFDTNRANDLTQLLDESKGSLATIAHNEWTLAATTCLSQEFSDMRLEQCAACHRPDGAPDNCIQCHRYHVSIEGK